MIKKVYFFLGLMMTLLCTPQVDALTAPFYDADLVELLKTNQVRLIVIRHGEAVHNLRRLMISTTSPGVYLTEQGQQQVTDAAELLKTQQVDRMYISPVFRTLQTAQILGKQLDIPWAQMTVEERLREQYFGEFENRSSPDYYAYFSTFEEVFCDAVPQGESGSELFTRTRQLLWDIASSHSNSTILLVTHGFNYIQISKCLTDTYCNVPPQAGFKVYDFGK